MTFEQLVQREGYVGTWERLRQLQSFKDYYQRWPYDDRETVLHLHGGDYIDEMAEQRVMDIGTDWDTERLLSDWTERQRTIAEYIIAGYKPRDIARMTGETNTGAIRWTKFSLKRKLKKLLAQP